MENSKKRNSILGFLPLVLVCMAIIGMLIAPAEFSKSAKNGVTLCMEVIVPSLFPFFVLSTLACELGANQYAAIALEGIMRKLFGVNGACTSAFVLGLTGGFPLGAKTAISIYEKKLCTKTEAERLLAFCNNTGPAFIFGVIGTGIFQSTKAGIIIYISHVLSAITVGMIFKFYKRDKLSKYDNNHVNFQISTCKFSKALSTALKSSLISVANICAVVIFFAVAIRMLNFWNIVPFLSQILAYPLSFLGIGKETIVQILTGFVEMTTGLFSLASSNLPMVVRLTTASFILGWSGISVHCQVMSFMSNCNLSLKPYIWGKVLSAIFNSIYTFTLVSFFPFSVATSIINSSSIISVSIPQTSFPFSFCTALVMWTAFLIPSVIKSTFVKFFSK